MPEDVHHSLDLDVGVDRISARARLVSIEFKSSTAFGEGKVRPSEHSGNPSGTEDGGWGGLSTSSPSSTDTIEGVGEAEGPRVRTSLKIELPRFRDLTGFPTPNSLKSGVDVDHGRVLFEVPTDDPKSRGDCGGKAISRVPQITHTSNGLKHSPKQFKPFAQEPTYLITRRRRSPASAACLGTANQIGFMFPNAIMCRRDPVSAEHRTTAGRAIEEEKSTDAADIPQHEWTACVWRKHHVPVFAGISCVEFIMCKFPSVYWRC
jgi:hypothetical protein